VFVVKKTVVKRFALKGETVRTLQGIELLQIAGALSTVACVSDGCPQSLDPTRPCQCTQGLSSCQTPDQGD
jgi:hypothetical protein